MQMSGEFSQASFSKLYTLAQSFGDAKSSNAWKIIVGENSKAVGKSKITLRKLDSAAFRALKDAPKSVILKKILSGSLTNQGTIIQSTNLLLTSLQTKWKLSATMAVRAQ